MFDLAWSEMAIIGVVALVVVGPKDLPKLMRSAGQWAQKARRIADDFKGQVNEAMREADLEDLRSSVNDLKSLNPTNMIRDELSKLAEPVQSAMTDAETQFRAAESSVSESIVGPATVDAAELAPPPPVIDTADTVHVELPEPMRLEGEPDLSAPVPVAAADPIDPLKSDPASPARELDAKA